MEDGSIFRYSFLTTNMVVFVHFEAVFNETSRAVDFFGFVIQHVARLRYCSGDDKPWTAKDARPLGRFVALISHTKQVLYVAFLLIPELSIQYVNINTPLSHIVDHSSVLG